jgi:hypothetical protein
MNVPGLWQQDSEPFSASASSGPEHRFVLDVQDKVLDRGSHAFEDTIVSVLPKHPQGEQRGGGEAFVQGLSSALPHDK